MGNPARDEGTPVPESLLAGVKGWLRDGTELLRVRLELLSVEAREHALGVVELLLFGLATVLLLMLGLGFFAVLITVLLWDSHRALALAVFATLFLALGSVAWALTLRGWRRQQRWFEASATELARDGERLRP